jgi:hypothetical protein
MGHSEITNNNNSSIYTTKHMEDLPEVTNCSDVKMDVKKELRNGKKSSTIRYHSDPSNYHLFTPLRKENLSC